MVEPTGSPNTPISNNDEVQMEEDSTVSSQGTIDSPIIESTEGKQAEIESGDDGSKSSSSNMTVITPEEESSSDKSGTDIGKIEVEEEIKVKKTVKKKRRFVLRRPRLSLYGNKNPNTNTNQKKEKKNRQTLLKNDKLIIGKMYPTYGYHKMNHFPEMEEPQVRNKPNIGICFSGGGCRSAAVSMGYLRALSKMNLIKKLRYLSAISGGSWATIPYLYLQKNTGISDEVFLGQILDPEQCTMQMLALTPNKSLAFAISHTSMGSRFVKHAITGAGAFTYARSLRDIFLGPFGCGKERTYFTYLEEHRNAIVERNNETLSPKDFICYHDENRPFFVIGGVMLQYQSTMKASQRLPFEFTPLYCGSFNFYPSIKARKEGTMTMPIGGGFVEPIVFNTPLPWHHQDVRLLKQNLIRTPSRSHEKLLYHRLHLSDVIATTGAAPAMPLAQTGFTSNGLPQFLYYSPISVKRGLLPPVPILSTIRFAKEGNQQDLYEDDEDAYSSSSDSESSEVPISINGKEMENVELECDIDVSDSNTPMSSSEEDEEIEMIDNNLDVMDFYSKLKNRRVHHAFRPPKSRQAEVNKYNFGDGGSLDNLGIMALLRRKVKKIIVCINSKNSFKVNDPVYTNNPAEDMALLMGPYHYRRYVVEKGIMEHMSRKYFNYYPMQLKVFRKELDFVICHVFKDDDGTQYQRLIRDINKKIVEGQPAIIRKTYEVVDNKYFGIDGGWHVDVLWVYHCVNKGFESRLPPETRELIRKKKTILANFPHFRTIYENKKSLIGLLPEQTQLLGHQGCFNMLEEEEQIKAFFEEAEHDAPVVTTKQQDVHPPKPVFTSPVTEESDTKDIVELMDDIIDKAIQQASLDKDKQTMIEFDSEEVKTDSCKQDELVVSTSQEEELVISDHQSIIIDTQQGVAETQEAELEVSETQETEVEVSETQDIQDQDVCLEIKE